jgi:hypothetical protein
MSRNHRHAVFTDAPTWVQLPSGLWCTQYVSAQTNYCTIPDITELLGATAATWMAWVRKNGARPGVQSIASDWGGAGEARWLFGYEGSEGSWRCYVANGTDSANNSMTGFTADAWHFCWMRFTGNSATGLEQGIDGVTDTPVSTTSVAALGVGVLNHTYIGRQTTIYSSITLAALGIAARALTDEQIAIWREKYCPLIGV